MQNGECGKLGGINAYFKNGMQWNAHAMNANAINPDASKEFNKQMSSMITPLNK